MVGASIPYCGPGAVPGAVWAAWNLDPWLLLALAVLLGGWARLRGAGGPGRADGWFGVGWAALLVAFVSPLCALSAALFSARIGHHLLLVAVAAPLLALALRERVEGWLAVPLPVVPVALLHTVAFWAWHAPGPYAAALGHHGLYWLMELSLLGSALLFWLACLDRRAGLGVVVPAIIGVMAQMGLLGALLAFARVPLYAAHATTTWPWGLSPLEDQQLAGLVMWVPGALPYLVLVLMLVAGRLAGRVAIERRG
jgi:putative membrane protein